MGLLYIRVLIVHMNPSSVDTYVAAILSHVCLMSSGVHLDFDPRGGAK